LILQEIQESNQQTQGAIEIRKTSHHGWGLFALKDYPQGHVLMTGRIVQTLDTRHTHTIQTDWNTHVVMDLPSRLINHVCGGNANVGIQPPSIITDTTTTTDSVVAYVFVARIDIVSGEELLWDYETSEYEMNMTCTCGSSSCRGKLRGFRYHGDMVRSLYGDDYIAPYLLQPKNEGIE
jgi:SET domain-containing protein